MNSQAWQRPECHAPPHGELQAFTVAMTSPIRSPDLAERHETHSGRCSDSSLATRFISTTPRPGVDSGSDIES
jgi:hypothetical protein